MKSIGGYFELETNPAAAYYPAAIALNTARNAFEYVLLVRKYSKVYVPYFTCEVMFEPLKKLDIEFQFYQIDKNLEPIFDYSLLKGNEGFLYTNYFGVKDNYINKLVTQVDNVIIDNAQSFFSPSLKDIDTFYSCRKFFGVSDGALLYCNSPLPTIFEKDQSIDRMSHLLIRADSSAEAGYLDFCRNDAALSNQPIKMMSNLTQKLMMEIDYQNSKKKRLENFNFLHEHLASKNELFIDKHAEQVPLVYPFWTKNKNLRNRLIANKVYCATYWPKVLEYCSKDSLEVQLTNELVHLPIDQRYGLADMKYILEYV